MCKYQTSKAQRIVRTYIATFSPLEINISSAERSAIIAKIDNASKTVDKDAFDSAYENVFKMVLHQHYTKFVCKKREEEVKVPKTTIGMLTTKMGV
jgi:ABC-type uncharacterized transport system substrate-binding protein